MIGLRGGNDSRLSSSSLPLLFFRLMWNCILSYYVLEVNQPVEEPCQEDCEEEQDKDKKEGHKEVRSRRPAKEGGVLLLLPLLLHLLLLLHTGHKSVSDFFRIVLPI